MSYHVNRFFFGIVVLFLGTTILLSCNNPHATLMDGNALANVDQVDNNQADVNGQTPLHMAVAAGQTEVIRELLENIPEGRDRVALINQRNNNGQPPLHMAASAGQTEVVNELLDSIPVEHRVALITHGNNRGDTPLHEAARAGNAEIVNLLAELGATINQRNEHGQTPLHVAVALGRTEAVSALLNRILAGQARVDIINQGDRYGNTPLHEAARAGNVEIVRALIDSLPEGHRVAIINHGNNRGNTPLHVAVALGRTEAVSALLNRIPAGQARVDIINQGNRYGHTPLHFAARAGNVEIVRALIAGVPDGHRVALINQRSRSNHGATALSRAVQGRHVRATGALLVASVEAGMDMREILNMLPPFLRLDNSVQELEALGALLRNERFSPHTSEIVAGALIKLFHPR